MRILNFGSLNIDLVYRVPHVVRPGETLGSRDLSRFAGGKGLNQSVALGRAGADVGHAGRVGEDGRWLLDVLRESGVETACVDVGTEPTGHAVIQVDDAGENAIVLFGGANRAQSRDRIDAALSGFGEGDWLLLQNEINETAYIMEAARRRGMRVVLNPAPFGEEVRDYPLALASMLILNETEAEGLSGAAGDAALEALAASYPDAEIVLTLGARGARYRRGDADVFVEACKVRAVDTTAAGDTFIGFLLAELMRGEPAEGALRFAARAAALSVSRAGAAASIPTRADVEAFSGD